MYILIGGTGSALDQPNLALGATTIHVALINSHVHVHVAFMQH